MREEAIYYCEVCGKEIFYGELLEGTEDQHGNKATSGNFIDGAGVCAGDCERELCGNCGDWDEEGCCPECSEKNKLAG